MKNQLAGIFWVKNQQPVIFLFTVPNCTFSTQTLIPCRNFYFPTPVFSFTLFLQIFNALSHSLTFNKLENKYFLKTQILENFHIAGNCRNKNQQTKTATQNILTLIFGQHDPGKTPYNSWGKPVWKLLFIFWILLLQWCRNLHRKKNYSNFET